MVNDRLAGKVAVVTGAGRGIGRAVAHALALQGCRVVLASRSVGELEAVAEEILAAGGQATFKPTDVAVRDDCFQLMDFALAQFGPVDILVNNAGIARFAPVWEIWSVDAQEMLAVNLMGALHCSQAALKQMMPRRSGSILQIASTSGLKPYLEQSLYCASKAALIALSKSMALELRPYNIGVHTVCPGAVDTRLAEEIHPTRNKVGWIQPQDVADACLYLLNSPENITVDEIVIRRSASEPM